MKFRWPFRNPLKKRRQVRVGAQGVGCMKVPRQFGLGQGRMYFLMANVMHQNRWPALAAFQLWDQVMLALFHARRNGAQT